MLKNLWNEVIDEVAFELAEKELGITGGFARDGSHSLKSKAGKREIRGLVEKRDSRVGGKGAGRKGSLEGLVGKGPGER